MQWCVISWHFWILRPLTFELIIYHPASGQVNKDSFPSGRRPIYGISSSISSSQRAMPPLPLKGFTKYWAIWGFCRITWALCRSTITWYPRATEEKIIFFSLLHPDGKKCFNFFERPVYKNLYFWNLSAPFSSLRSFSCTLECRQQMLPNPIS